MAHDELRALLHAHGIEPSHHEAALSAPSAGSVVALLQTLAALAADPNVAALVQSLLDRLKKNQTAP